MPASAPPQVSHLERHGYLFGHKLDNSMSPLFHNTIYEDLGLKWEQVRLDSSDIPQFLQLIRDEKFYGASVTMPNKVAIMDHLDEMTEECREVGACNTLFLKEQNGKRLFCGANTDVIGVREAFYQNVADHVFHDKPAMVIGGGGAARSAVYALRKWMRATDIYLVNRDQAEVEAVITDSKARGYGDGLVNLSTIEQALAVDAPGAIVACVPDLLPKTAEEKTVRAIIQTILAKERKGCMLEMCYNPSPWTQLGEIAEKQQWQVILGTEAMIWQGLEQDRYWTGALDTVKVNGPLVEKVRRVIRKELDARRQTNGS